MGKIQVESTKYDFTPTKFANSKLFQVLAMRSPTKGALLIVGGSEKGYNRFGVKKKKKGTSSKVL